MTAPSPLGSQPRQSDPAHGPGRRHDRVPEPSRGDWCTGARDDPITGLVALPGFFAQLPMLLEASLGNGTAVGLAIGDVDNLKESVEGMKAVDAQSFGHLAGNALMGRLGTIARNWLWEDGPGTACLATFGGDEVVLLAGTASPHSLFDDVARCGTSCATASHDRSPSVPASSPDRRPESDPQ